MEGRAGLRSRVGTAAAALLLAVTGALVGFPAPAQADTSPFLVAGMTAGGTKE